MFRILSTVQKYSLTSFTKSHIRQFSNSSSLLKNVGEDDGPVKFSSSRASTYRAKTTRSGYYDSRLWYEPYVIIASISVFLIYFTILREENDIDYELGRSLYTRIEGLEEFQLRKCLEYNESHGKDTQNIIARLNEIEAEKQKLKKDFQDTRS